MRRRKRKRKRGTFTRTLAQVRGHLDFGVILRVILWALLLGLAILAVNEPRGWWSFRTKVEYLGTAGLLLINTIMVLRAWRTRKAAAAQAAASTNQAIKNGVIRICIPYTRITMPAWWYRIWVDHSGLSYTLYYKKFLRGEAVPSDIAYCANPDVMKTWTQSFLKVSCIVVEAKDEPNPIVFWVRLEDGLVIIPILRGLITSACKDNGISRWIPDRRKSVKG